MIVSFAGSERALGLRPRSALILLLLAVALIVVAVVVFYPGEVILRGLLIDLELNGPDHTRCSQLRDALTERLPKEVPGLSAYRVTLEYSHFSQLTEDTLDSGHFHFLLLSPQGTPWHMYKGESGLRLDSAKRLVREVILGRRIPVLGICGGHQFLAMAFGATVDFIDPALVGTFPERYPEEALSERGVIELQTLDDDPIFSGLVKHPGTFRVVESHYEEVKQIPQGFVNLAAGELSEVQIIRIPGKLTYGMAFHPERWWDGKGCNQTPVPAGKLLLANFLKMAAGNKD